MASYAARTKELFRKYGRVAVGVHFAVYFTGLGACYVAVERGVKVDKFLRSWGLMGEKKEKVEAGAAEGGGGGGREGRIPSATASTSSTSSEHEDDGRNWFARALSGHGSSLALAFVANKALFPVRAPITLGLTPAVARALRANAAASATAVRNAAASEASARESSSSGSSSSLRSNGGESGGSAVSDTK